MVYEVIIQQTNNSRHPENRNGCHFDDSPENKNGYYNGLQDRIPIAKTVMCELFSTKNRKLEKISVTANFKDRREGG